MSTQPVLIFSGRLNCFQYSGCLQVITIEDVFSSPVLWNECSVPSAGGVFLLGVTASFTAWTGVQKSSHFCKLLCYNCRLRSYTLANTSVLSCHRTASGHQDAVFPKAQGTVLFVHHKLTARRIVSASDLYFNLWTASQGGHWQLVSIINKELQLHSRGENKLFNPCMHGRDSFFLLKSTCTLQKTKQKETGLSIHGIRNDTGKCPPACSFAVAKEGRVWFFTDKE